MEEVEILYNEGKLLVRAMDQPTILSKDGTKYYECNEWVNEFDSLMHEGLDSLSTTLIIPGIGVRNYKNVGYLINSDTSNIIHISKSDSVSYGSIRHGDFHANKEDFDNIVELANYIKEEEATEMNEVNINTSLDAIVGLYINVCEHAPMLLKKVYAVKCMLKELTGIDYPIYLYDWMKGKLDKVDLSKEKELIDSLEAKEVFLWPESYNKPVYVPIVASTYHK